MPYKTETKCKVCMSKYRLEIEELRTKQTKTYDQISTIMREKYGFVVSIMSLQRHFLNHFEFVTDQLAMVAKESKALFKENAITSGERIAKLSGMIAASYEYVTSHFDELEMKTALQMLFGSLDQLTKMEATGAFVGAGFLVQFQELLSSIKKDTIVQKPLDFIADEQGQAHEIVVVENPVDKPDDNLPNL